MKPRSLAPGAAIVGGALIAGAGTAGGLFIALAWAHGAELVPADLWAPLRLTAVAVHTAVAAAVALVFAQGRGPRSRPAIMAATLGSAGFGLVAGWLARALADGAAFEPSLVGFTEPVLAAMARGPRLAGTQLPAGAWVLEATLIVTLIAALAHRATQTLWCARCHARCHQTLVTTVGPAPIETVRAKLGRGDFVWLGRLGAPVRGRGLRLCVAECGCGTTSALLVSTTRRLRHPHHIATLRLGRDARRTIGRLALRLELEPPTTGAGHPARWAAPRGA